MKGREGEHLNSKQHSHIRFKRIAQKRRAKTYFGYFNKKGKKVFNGNKEMLKESQAYPGPFGLHVGLEYHDYVLNLPLAEIPKREGFQQDCLAP